jgi:stage V sporulation protein B
MGWNIDGVVFSYTVFGFVVSVLNYCSIVEATSFRGSFMKTYWLPLAASALMGVCVYVINLLFSKGLGVIIHHASIVRLVSVCVSVVVGVVVYFAAILALHGVDEMDLLDMPMGTRLIRLAKRMHLLRDAQ